MLFFVVVSLYFALWVASRRENKNIVPFVSPPVVTKSPRRLATEAIVGRIAGRDVAEEKLDALCLDSQHALITARGGSGKTQTIALKVVLAVHQRIHPSQTLSLCFNKSASLELARRIECLGVRIAPVSTFHALAHAIVKPHPRQLVFGERQVGIIRHLLGGNLDRGGIEKDEFIEDILGFISSAKHREMSIEEVQKRCYGIEGIPTLAVAIFEAYTRHLETHKLLDFDDLIGVATDRLNTLSALPIVSMNKSRCDLGSLRLVALDEAQDLSPSFYGLVRALIDKNSSMGVYAVGDDFQAINSFAGSSLEYFRNFERYFPDASRSNLLTNYRSRSAIVDFANQHMNGLGVGGIAIKQGGEVSHVRIDGGMGRVHVRDAVCEIVQMEHHRSVMVLARRNACHGVDLGVWQNQLSQLHPRVRISTIHKAKGGEADVVVYLKEREHGGGRLAYLNGLLGVSMQEARDEERRIEYVALTRAKEKLVIVE